MALKEVVVPKRYKNGDPLFERSLDAWRLAVVELLQDVQKNFTQLRKDCFFPSYDYDNDGNANLGQSLQTQINLLSSGGSPLTGTSSSTFSINTGGFAVTLDTLFLTASRTVYFPDGDGTFVYTDLAQTLTNKTLTAPTIAGATITGSVSFSGDVTFDTDLLFIDSANNKVLVGSVSSAFTDIFQIYKSLNGSILTSGIYNTSNTAGSSAVHSISVAGSSAGDAYQVYKVEGTNSWAQGINNSVSGDPFEWKNTNALTDDEYVMQLSGLGDGGINALIVHNHFNTAGTTSIIDALVGGSSAGDSIFRSRITGGDTWAWGGNNSVSDYWELTKNATLTDGQHLLQAQQGGSGANNILQLLNHNNTASSSAIFDITVGGTSAGNAFHRTTATGGSSFSWGLRTSTNTYQLQKSTSLSADYLISADQGGSGAANYWQVYNNNNTSSSHAQLIASVAGTSGGDPALLLQTQGGTSWYVASDTSLSQSFKVGTGSAVGTNTWLEITNTGICIITNPWTDSSDDTPESNRQINAQSLVKAFGKASSTGADTASYNVSSVTQNSTGNYTVTIDRDFANANYAIVITPFTTTTDVTWRVEAQAVGSFTVEFASEGTLRDVDFYYACLGTLS